MQRYAIRNNGRALVVTANSHKDALDQFTELIGEGHDSTAIYDDTRAPIQDTNIEYGITHFYICNNKKMISRYIPNVLMVSHIAGSE